MPANEQPENYVRRLCLKRFGLDLRKIPEGSTPTPDFELVRGSVRQLVAEVKTFEPFDAPGHGLDAPPWELMDGCLREDNGPSRVGAVIHKAAKQLEGSSCPRVLIIVNDEPCLDVFDLQAASHGYLKYKDGRGRVELDWSATHVAEGRIRDSKKRIDLFLWVDRWCEKISFRFRGQPGREIAERFFGYRPDSLWRAQQRSAP